jgi:hypothetical protein
MPGPSSVGVEREASIQAVYVVHVLFGNSPAVPAMIRQATPAAGSQPPGDRMEGPDARRFQRVRQAGDVFGVRTLSAYPRSSPDGHKAARIRKM